MLSNYRKKNNPPRVVKRGVRPLKMRHKMGCDWQLRTVCMPTTVIATADHAQSCGLITTVLWSQR